MVVADQQIVLHDAHRIEPASQGLQCGEVLIPALGIAPHRTRPRPVGDHVIDGYIDPVFESMRAAYSGAVTLCQDLTVFNVTAGAVVARQAAVDLAQQAVVGLSDTDRVLVERLPSPACWTDAAIDWQSKLT